MQSVGAEAFPARHTRACSFKGMIIARCAHFTKQLYLLDIQPELFTVEICWIFASKQSRAGRGGWEVTEPDRPGEMFVEAAGGPGDPGPQPAHLYLDSAGF